MSDKESDAVEPKPEEWVFGGSRVDNGKRFHAWIPLDDPHRNELFYKPRGSFAVGSVYEVQVVRREGRVSKYPDPKYLRRCEDEALRDQVSARHAAAEVVIGRQQLERADKKDDPVTVAVDRLAELARHVHPSQRNAFAAMVLNKIGRSW
ncbi:hypothetical protein [Lentzea sp. NBRC 102530]|uniref:hypothetical protein n=1 Tax=Lentzea sp. NBRC 102530 TaxID=3032201 RepID=UPI0024A609AF|nr:hypothetical protein [Lentzea sp. NBRC 102530]GLY54878.1 hypothetical protein Lesp01_85330 [Lentzea sp. NBRC 102530]